ncbi:MAG: ABC transporter ATP-binding protein [Oscillospiraceae bacterium]|nr:ABC transporter ATP-binding protein [Oscillospiraceae bacterium]
MADLLLSGINKYIKKNHVLKDIHLSLDAGQIYGFYGRNGSGKTMLFKVLSGLVIPDSGHVVAFGQELQKDVSFPPEMGILFDRVGLWPQYTGYKCLQLLASIRNVASEQDMQTAMDRVGLDWRDRRTFRQYSLGMKQKLLIAQAIMEKPRLLVLDEPTNSLDEATVNGFRAILNEERQRGALILMASHNKEDIRLLCDDIFLMEEGRCSHAEGGI